MQTRDTIKGNESLVELFQFLFSCTTFSKHQNASFWCKPHYNWIPSYRVMKDFTMLKQYVTKEFEYCFCQYLKNNIPTSDSFLLIMSHIVASLFVFIFNLKVNIQRKFSGFHNGTPLSKLYCYIVLYLLSLS